MSAAAALPGAGARVAALWINELGRFRAQWWAWIVLVLPAATAFLLPLGMGFDESFRRLQRSAASAGAAPALGGYAALANALHQGLYLGGLGLLIFAAQLVAAERAQGQVRDLLGGPLRRWELVASKWLALVAILLLLYALTLAAAFAGTALVFDFADVVEEGVTVIAASDLRAETQRAALLYLPPALALLSFGLFVSCLAAQGGLAAALALFGLGALELAKGVFGSGPRLRHYLFNDWLPSPFEGDAYLGGLRRFAQGFSDTLWSPDGPELALNLAVPLAWAAAFLACSFAVMARKEFPE